MIPGIFAAGAMGQGSGPTPPSTDPYWANVVSLLHFDGTNGSTTFTDQKGKTWARSGAGVEISTAQQVFGPSSLLVGSSQFLSTGASSDFNFGTGDFTIEGWWRNSGTGRRYIYANGGNTAAILITPSSGLLEVYGPGSYVINAGSTPFSINTWYYLALSRIGNTWRFFRAALGDTNTTLYQSLTDSRSWGTSSSGVVLAQVGGTNIFTGYIDDFRVTKGVGRYSAAFPVPTAPFPDS